MTKILKLKDEYVDKVVSIKMPQGYSVNIREGISQKYMNTLYDLGLTQYFDVIESVSLVDDTIEVINDQPTAVFEGLFDITPKPEVTPTPALKKKAVAVNQNNN